MKYWLFKTEPEKFSVQDLAKAPRKTTCWDGVRNYQARNFLRDTIKRGDQVLIYHSNADPSAVVGTAVVVREAYPDPSAFDKSSDYYDEKSKHDSPTWVMVDIQLVEIFKTPPSLEGLRAIPTLKGMELLRRGSRLSVQPVSPQEFQTVVRLGNAKPTKASS